jgi:hypothetical protein
MRPVKMVLFREQFYYLPAIQEFMYLEIAPTRALLSDGTVKVLDIRLFILTIGAG